MSIDPETLMAYADGELDPSAAKRVERAIAEDPELAREVERHRALSTRLNGHFAPLLQQPVPDRLTSLINTNVISMPARPKRLAGRWREASALAACLLLGVLIGRGADTPPVKAGPAGLYAANALQRSLDTQLASARGDVTIPVSFRDRDNRYCRVFNSAAVDGIACRDDRGWALRQTRPGSLRASVDYRQAGSGAADLMAAAQNMMAGEPLDATAERNATAKGWR